MNWISKAATWLLTAIPKAQATLTLIASLIAAVAGVQVSRCLPPSNSPPTSPAPLPGPTEQKPASDPREAITRIQVGNAGCSATITLPQLTDRRYLVLCAAHCVDRVGQEGTMWVRNGLETKIVCVALDRESDCSWWKTLDAFDSLPALHLADKSPEVGTKVMHAGFGIHVPGNTEYGTVTQTGVGKQVRFSLSVSSGDSGGGICIDASGRIISPVCCTTNRSAMGSVWGASPEECKRHRPVAVHNVNTWTPIEVPLRMIEP
jgi:hypothetical protein